MAEPVNRVRSPRESTFIEMNSELLQSMVITHTFFESPGNLFVIFSGNFSENGTDEMDMIHLP